MGELKTVTVLEGDHYFNVESPSIRGVTFKEAYFTLRSDNASLTARVKEAEQQAKNFEEYAMKGVAFRDELQARVKELEELYTNEIKNHTVTEGLRLKAESRLAALEKVVRDLLLWSERVTDFHEAPAQVAARDALKEVGK